MPNKRKIKRYSWIVLLVALPVGLGVSCFGPLPDHEAVHLLPNTEKVTCGEDDLSLSPDDRWLVFSEISAPISEWGNIKPKYHYQMASIDLKTTKKTNHRLPKDLNEDCYHGFWEIGYVGEESWGDGFFVLAGYDRRRYLVLDPQNEFSN